MDSTERLVQAVLDKVPSASRDVALDLIAECNADLNKVFQLVGVPQASKQRQLTFDGFISKKKPPQSSQLKAVAQFKPLIRQTSTNIDLFNNEQVLDAGIFCTLHTNVLDQRLANILALQLEESSKDWPQAEFYLFDRKVKSPHTTAMFSDNEDLLTGKTSPTYQGHKTPTPRPFSAEMSDARETVRRIVKLYDDDWECNVVLANKYASKTDKIDYHSDQLTHIGPKPTIAALSFGCTREFKLRKRSHTPKDTTYTVHVPHNSLLIMHSGCQEIYKHCVPPMRCVEPDPLLHETRISLTFRNYLPQFTSDRIPKCKCDQIMILRNTIATAENRYKYIWQCGNKYSENTGCDEVKDYLPKFARGE